MRQWHTPQNTPAGRALPRLPALLLIWHRWAPILARLLL